ncbi:hypothetical protein HN836_01020, partial [Candidatus Woesearchaeota archaeon]|nr:hypothetical protein [Candidatus Woesearchaeota archaeon]
MDKKIKILFMIDRKYPTDHVFLEEVYAKILSKQKFEITWLMKSKKRIEKRKKAWWHGNKVIVIPSRGNGLTEYLYQIIDLLKLKTIVSKEKFDIIQVRNDPIMGLIANYFSKKNSAKFVVQLSHLKAEETINFAKKGFYGNKIKNLLVGTIEKFLRQQMLKRADLIFPISQEMKIYFKDLNIKKPMIPLQLCVIKKVKVEMKKIELIKKRYNLKNSTVFIYLGTLSRSRELEKMIQAFSIVHNNKQKTKMIIVGEGKEPNDLEFLKKIVKKLNLEDSI